MKIYQTVYETSYGKVTAQFKDQMTFEEAEALGKKYCEDYGHNYVRTQLV
jgi:hypothetical protein